MEPDIGIHTPFRYNYPPTPTLPTLLGCHRAPVWVLWVIDSHWLSISHMVVYMFPWYSLHLSHPLLPHHPRVHTCFLERLLSPNWIVLTPLLKTDWLALKVKVYFLAFRSVSLTSVYSFMLVPKCLDYYNFVVSFEIGNCESFNCVLFQERFGYSGFLAFWYFRISLSISVKQSTGILRGIELNLQIIFGSITS